jgi:hypothetical protein
MRNSPSLRGCSIKSLFELTRVPRDRSRVNSGSASSGFGFFSSTIPASKEQSSSVVEDDTTMLTVEETDNTASSAETPEMCQCDCQPRIAELLTEIEFLKITGRRMRKSRKNRDNP